MIRDFGDKTKVVLEIWSRIKRRQSRRHYYSDFCGSGPMSGWDDYKRVQRYKRRCKDAGVADGGSKDEIKVTLKSEF